MFNDMHLSRESTEQQETWYKGLGIFLKDRTGCLQVESMGIEPSNPRL